MPLMQGRRRRRESQEDSDAEEPPRRRLNSNDSEEEEDDDMDGREPSAAQAADEQLAKKLIRYAISCEYSRTPIRRDGIKERVLRNQGRAFRRIFDLAQKQLKEVWGMELRELPVREKLSLHEKRKAINSTAKAGSNIFVLSSSLPPAYRNVKILAPSKSPSADEEATYAAFYTTVVSFIWLNGGELSDQKLNRYLSRLNADRNLASEKTEMVLKKLERQGYLFKRIERPPVGQDGEQVVTWHIGGRSKDEIGLDGVMGLVREVYGDSDPELEKKLASSLGIKQSAATGDLEAVAEEEEKEEVDETPNGRRRSRARRREDEEED